MSKTAKCARGDLPRLDAHCSRIKRKRQSKIAAMRKRTQNPTSCNMWGKLSAIPGNVIRRESGVDINYRNVQCPRCIADVEAGKVMELHYACLDRMLLCQMVKEIIDDQDLIRGVIRLDGRLMKVDAPAAPSMPDASPASRSLDKNPPHRFGGCCQKVGSTVPRLVGPHYLPQVPKT